VIVLINANFKKIYAVYPSILHLIQWFTPLITKPNNDDVRRVNLTKS